ncbi:MAG: DUF1217 domain-containing protein [Henriciella sp.]
MFQPVIPLSGLGGWNFLQSTYDRQLETFSSAPQIKNDTDYLTEKLAQRMPVEDFLSDQRLRRITLTAFGLEGEDWKVGFHRKVLDEVQDFDSTFLTRLNNPQYTRFAEALQPIDGELVLSSDQVEEIAARYAAESFELAVGEQDDSMRLSLNYQADIQELVTEGSTDNANMFKLLGSLPMREVLTTALNLPSDISNLDIDDQAAIFQDRLRSQFQVSSLQDLKNPETIERVLQRYQAVQSINQNFASTSSASTALTLLSNAVGFGAVASQNLFLSNF